MSAFAFAFAFASDIDSCITSSCSYCEYSTQSARAINAADASKFMIRAVRGISKSHPITVPVSISFSVSVQSCNLNLDTNTRYKKTHMFWIMYNCSMTYLS